MKKAIGITIGFLIGSSVFIASVGSVVAIDQIIRSFVEEKIKRRWFNKETQ